MFKPDNITCYRLIDVYVLNTLITSLLQLCTTLSTYSPAITVLNKSSAITEAQQTLLKERLYNLLDSVFATQLVFTLCASTISGKGISILQWQVCHATTKKKKKKKKEEEEEEEKGKADLTTVLHIRELPHLHMKLAVWFSFPTTIHKNPMIPS